MVPRQWNKQVFPFKKQCKCGGCGGSVTAEVKYRRTKKGVINTHIYYHCNRIRDYKCKEPYITEVELIRQLITLLPKLKINKKYLWNEFNEEIKRLINLKGIICKQTIMEFELTPHRTKSVLVQELSEEKETMLKEYILHILQFGTPEERIKILGGIQSCFELTQRTLNMVGNC